MIVRGIQEKTGKYEGNEYHNIMLHCTKLDDSCYGEITEVVKIKFANVREVFGKPMSAADWQNLVGKNIRVYYNRYGVPEEVKIQQSVQQNVQSNQQK